jgi:hypothetical protein
MSRSRTAALHRKSEALRHFASGCTFDEVARRVGFAHRGTAHKVVNAALRERIAEDVDEYRRLEVARLDALQSALWDELDSGATNIRLRAAALILKVIEQRAKVLGLHHRSAEPPRMLVAPRRGNSEKATSDGCGCDCHV